MSEKPPSHRPNPLLWLDTSPPEPPVIFELSINPIVPPTPIAEPPVSIPPITPPSPIPLDTMDPITSLKDESVETLEEDPLPAPAVKITEDPIKSMWEELATKFAPTSSGWAMVGIPVKTIHDISAAIAAKDAKTLKALAAGKTATQFPAVVSNILRKFGLLK